jgi:hypothetical protein
MENLHLGCEDDIIKIMQMEGCRAYTPGTHARKDKDGLLLEFPCNPIRTRSV